MSTEEETLITIPRFLFDDIGAFQGVMPLHPKFLPLLDEKNFIKIPRSQAEEDPTHKQLIVYFTVRDRLQFLAYWRDPKGGDPRLHSKFTVGFGGHINTEDKSFLGAVTRELEEEIGNSPVRSIELRGLINDDSNKVGEVHLGLYYEVVLCRWLPKTTKDLNVGTPALTSWKDLEENYDSMESWSKLVFDFLTKRAIRPLGHETIIITEGGGGS